MAIKTPLEKVEEVQAAITRVLGGQRVTIGNKTFVEADLEVLQKMEREYLREYRASQGVGGIAITVGTPRRDY